MARSTAVPGPRIGGIARRPVAKDTNPVAASTVRKGKAVTKNARSRGRGPVVDGARYADHAPTIARTPVKIAATRGFQFTGDSGAVTAWIVTEIVRSASALSR